MNSLIVHHISSHGEMCGIGHYTGHLMRTLKPLGVESVPVPLEWSKHKYMSRQELRRFFEGLADGIPENSLVHVQHEVAFFGGRYGAPFSYQMFVHLLKRLLSRGAKVVVTFHSTPPEIEKITFKTRIAGLFRKWTPKQELSRIWKNELVPLFASGDCTAMCHNQHTKLLYVRRGFPSKAMRVQFFPCAENEEWTPQEPSETSRLRARAKLGLAPDAVVLTTFGFISGYKGHRTVARSLQCLPDSHVFLVAGGRHPEGRDITLDTLLKETKREYWLEDAGAPHLRLIVTGSLSAEEIARVWEATDIVVCCYDDVPFSMSAALTDALQSGKPIVASEIAAFVEMNEMGQCLALVPPGASYELALTIRKIIAQPDLRQRLKDNAAQYARTHTWKRFAEESIKCYKTALKPKIKKSKPKAVGHSSPTPDLVKTS